MADDHKKIANSPHYFHYDWRGKLERWVKRMLSKRARSKLKSKLRSEQRNG